jgi:hypothetical protein
MTITVRLKLFAFAWILAVGEKSLMRLQGDNKDKIKMTIGDMGWNKKRTGNAGEAPVVWLWVTKD